MPRSQLKLMAMLSALVGSFSYIILLAVLNGSMGFLFSISITFFGALAVAKLLGGTVALSYTALCIIIVSCGIVRGGLRYLEQYSNHYIAFRLLAIIRDKLFGSLRQLAPAKLEDKQSGNLISMITADIETLEVFYAHTLSPILIATTVSMVVCGVIWYMSSYILALYALASYIVVGVILPIINSKLLSHTGKQYRTQLSQFNGMFMDTMKGSREIIMHNQVSQQVDNIDSATTKLNNTTSKLKAKMGIADGICGLAITLLSVGMLVVGSYLVTIDITMVLVCVVLLMSSFGPVVALNALPNNLNQTFASANRVFDLLAEKPQVEDITDGTNVAIDSLTVDNLCFGYNNTPVLDNFSMTVSKGELVAISGSSGCGKSTVLKLLLRFWSKDSGNICYNGMDIESINTNCLKSQVAMVSQNTYIFADTVAGNLRVANQQATDGQLVLACQQANIHDVIMALPQGYDTLLGVGGVDLSAGERQRLGLARAFVSNANILLLDEPTSNVDSINEGIILQSILSAKANKAIILISHRKSTLSIADRTYNIQGETL